MDNIEYHLNSNDSLGVLGYIIVSNQQIHSFQMDVLTEFLFNHNLIIEDTVIASILDGKEDAITLNKSLKSYEEESPQVRNELYYISLILAYVDGTMDASEKAILNQMKLYVNEPLILDEMEEKAKNESSKKREINNVLFVRPTFNQKIEKAEKQSFFQRLLSKIISFFKKLFFEKDAKEINQEKNKMLEYENKINECSKIAKEDFAKVEPLYEEVLAICEDVKNKISGYNELLSLEKGIGEQTAIIIKNFIELLNSDILNETKVQKNSFQQKERTMTDFTISLLGRTKAGKSTLHYVLTNQGSDKIGKGKQRTTRYNRVYQWNLLRIIDTPGIGSAEAEGRKDDDIAKSVLGESDVLCFVVADGSVLDDVLDMITEMSKYNKPIIVLINHKENITQDVKFDFFIKNPNNWLNYDNDSSLIGPINRIMREARNHNYEHQIIVCPVFLLAAQLATDENYSEYSEILWKSSNIEKLFEYLENCILLGGTLKRSQTILDETYYSFKNSYEKLSKLQIPLNDELSFVIRKKEEIHSALLKNKEKTMIEIKKELKFQFDKLENCIAYTFAEEYVDDQRNLNDKWQEYFRACNFETELQDAINIHTQSFIKIVEDNVKDLFSDLYYSLQLSLEAQEIFPAFDFDFTIFLKVAVLLLDLASLIVGLIVGGPWAIVITVVAVVISFITGFIPSTEKRRQKKINSLHKQIKECIKEQEESQKTKICDDINSKFDYLINIVSDVLNELSDGLNYIIELSNKVRVAYECQIDKVNLYYAERIVQFMFDYSDCGIRNDSIVTKVDRKEKGLIKIYVDGVIPNIIDLNNIISEKVEIHKN